MKLLLDGWVYELTDDRQMDGHSERCTDSDQLMN